MSTEAVQLPPEDFYRTNDMAMATYLKMEGNPVQQLAWIGGTCYWIFRITESLLDCVERFSDGEARVEPRQYNRIFTQTKREFYDSRQASNLHRS